MNVISPKKKLLGSCSVKGFYSVRHPDPSNPGISVVRFGVDSPFHVACTTAYEREGRHFQLLGCFDGLLALLEFHPDRMEYSLVCSTNKYKEWIRRVRVIGEQTVASLCYDSTLRFFVSDRLEEIKTIKLVCARNLKNNPFRGTIIAISEHEIVELSSEKFGVIKRNRREKDPKASRQRMKHPLCISADYVIIGRVGLYFCVLYDHDLNCIRRIGNKKESVDCAHSCHYLRNGNRIIIGHHAHFCLYDVENDRVVKTQPIYPKGINCVDILGLNDRYVVMSLGNSLALFDVERMIVVKSWGRTILWNFGDLTMSGEELIMGLDVSYNSLVQFHLPSLGIEFWDTTSLDDFKEIMDVLELVCYPAWSFYPSPHLCSVFLCLCLDFSR